MTGGAAAPRQKHIFAFLAGGIMDDNGYSLTLVVGDAGGTTHTADFTSLKIATAQLSG